MEKKEILDRVYEMMPHQLNSSLLVKSEIYYLNDKEFNELELHIFGKQSKNSLTIDENGELFVVESEQRDYDTIILNKCNIFKRVNREDKLKRIL